MKNANVQNRIASIKLPCSLPSYEYSVRKDGDDNFTFNHKIYYVLLNCIENNNIENVYKTFVNLIQIILRWILIE